MTEPAVNTAKAPPKRRLSTGAMIFQALGFLLCVAALGYCIYLVIKDPARREKMAGLLHQPLELAILVLLSMVVIAATGMKFRAMLKPVRTLPRRDMVAVNALCTLLGNLPFKISLLTRIFIHARRHELALPTILGWMGSVAILSLSTLGPPIAALLLRPSAGIDHLWWLITSCTPVILLTSACLIARLIRDDARWNSFKSWSARTLPAFVAKLLHGDLIARLRDGATLLGVPSAVLEAFAYRTLALLAGISRLALALAMTGAAISLTTFISVDTSTNWGHLIVLDCVYFLLQGAAPTGALGAREGGTLALLQSQLSIDLPVILLTISAAETAANLILGIAGAIYLRLDRLLRPATPQPSQANA
jgi:hypothetical protein